MSNYEDLELDFINRTMRLIQQYHDILQQFSFDEQFNYTLTINCLLGLIVLPKEKVITYVPTQKLTTEYKQEIGLHNSIINDNVGSLRDLIFSLRHAIAHFNLNVISDDEHNRIDWIEFTDEERGGETVAKFRSTELWPFLKSYTDSLLTNLKKYKK